MSKRDYHPVKKSNTENSKKIPMALLVYQDLSQVLQSCYACVSEIPLFTGTIMNCRAQNLNQDPEKNRRQHKSIVSSREKHHLRSRRLLYGLVAREMIRCFSSFQSIGLTK